MSLTECNNCGRLSPLTPYCGKCKYGRKNMVRRHTRADMVNAAELPVIQYSPEYRRLVQEILLENRIARKV